MRIGVVSTPWVPVPPPAYGGLEAVVDRLVRGFVADGHEVLLAAPANSACEVPMVPGTAEVDLDAALIGDAISETYHAPRRTRRWPAWMSSTTTRSPDRCTGTAPPVCPSSRRTTARSSRL